VCDNIYQHIDVKEQGKANSFSLGQSLWIGGEEYEDLDEIIARWAGVCGQRCVFSNLRIFYANSDPGSSKNNSKKYNEFHIAVGL
jgi:hypothetical protein